MTLAPSYILVPGHLLAREVVGRMQRGQGRVVVHTRMGGMLLCGAATRARHSRPPPALALVPCPKQPHLWATIAHRGARGTLDEFKAAWEGRLTHHGDTPKILQGNLAPAAIAHWRIILEPYPSSRRNWLVCNLAYRIEWHNVLHKMHAGPARGTQTAATDRLSLPGVFQTRSTYQTWAPRT
jgi:hypothetical protein